MNDLRIDTGPFFARGIDRIVVGHEAGTRALPELQHLPPAERGVQPQLDRLLSRPTLNSLVDDAIEPDIDDPELLLPPRFRAALRQALQTLRRRAERHQDPRSRDARTLQRAIGLLAEEDELRDLAQMYLSSLYQG